MGWEQPAASLKAAITRRTFSSMQSCKSGFMFGKMQEKAQKEKKQANRQDYIMSPKQFIQFN